MRFYQNLSAQYFDLSTGWRQGGGGKTFEAWDSQRFNCVINVSVSCFVEKMRLNY